ncbi:carboxy terminal-processing peptidase, partial [Escherichia coli]
DYPFVRDKEPWPKSEAESDELWRKRVKNDWLRLKLAGKTDAAIRDTLDKRYQNSLERAYKYKSDDVFQIFMDAYTTSIEP